MGRADSLPTSERRAAPGPSSLPRISWVFPKAKMRIFFSLFVISFTLATCEAACFMDPFKPELSEWELVWPITCVDPYDKKEHPIGSEWNTADCLRCACVKDGLSCCDRWGGPAVVEGCKTVINPETCKHEFYRLDDPSKRCL